MATTRDIKLRLLIEAVDDASKQLQDLRKNLGNLGDESEESGKKTKKAGEAGSKALDSLADSGERATGSMKGLNETVMKLRIAGQQMVFLGAALTGSIGMMVREAVSFEKAVSMMSAAVMGATASVQSLKASISPISRDTTLSINETASGMRGLADAGLSASEIIGAMRPIEDLATIGNMQLGEAVTLATGAMSSFNLKAGDLGGIIDSLAYVAGHTAATIGDLSEAVRAAGAFGEAAGVSIEETASTMGILAEKGRRGGKAVADFRTIIMALSDPTDNAKKALERLGVTIATSSDGTIELAETLRRLRDAHMGMSEASDIFGRRAASIATTLSEEADSLDRLTSATRNAHGESAKMAEIMESNLMAALVRLKNAMQELSVALASPLLGPLTSVMKMIREVVLSLTDFASRNKFLVGSIIAVIGGLGMLVTALGSTLYMGSKLVSLWSSFGNNLTVVLNVLKGAVGWFKAFFSIVGMGYGVVAKLQIAVSLLWQTITLHPIGALITAFLAVILVINAFIKDTEEAKKKAAEATAEIRTMADTLSTLRMAFETSKEGSDKAKSSLSSLKDELLKTAEKNSELKGAALDAANSIDTFSGTLRDGGVALDTFFGKLRREELKRMKEEITLLTDEIRKTDPVFQTFGDKFKKWLGDWGYLLKVIRNIGKGMGLRNAEILAQWETEKEEVNKVQTAYSAFDAKVREIVTRQTEAGTMMWKSNEEEARLFFTSTMKLRGADLERAMEIWREMVGEHEKALARIKSAEEKGAKSSGAVASAVATNQIEAFAKVAAERQKIARDAKSLPEYPVEQISRYTMELAKTKKALEDEGKAWEGVYGDEAKKKIQDINREVMLGTETQENASLRIQKVEVEKARQIMVKAQAQHKLLMEYPGMEADVQKESRDRMEDAEARYNSQVRLSSDMTTSYLNKNEQLLLSTRFQSRRMNIDNMKDEVSKLRILKDLELEQWEKSEEKKKLLSLGPEGAVEAERRRLAIVNSYNTKITDAEDKTQEKIRISRETTVKMTEELEKNRHQLILANMDRELAAFEASQELEQIMLNPEGKQIAEDRRNAIRMKAYALLGRSHKESLLSMQQDENRFNQESTQGFVANLERKYKMGKITGDEYLKERKDKEVASAQAAIDEIQAKIDAYESDPEKSEVVIKLTVDLASAQEKLAQVYDRMKELGEDLTESQKEAYAEYYLSLAEMSAESAQNEEDLQKRAIEASIQRFNEETLKKRDEMLKNANLGKTLEERNLMVDEWVAQRQMVLDKMVYENWIAFENKKFEEKTSLEARRAAATPGLWEGIQAQNELELQALRMKHQQELQMAYDSGKGQLYIDQMISVQRMELMQKEKDSFFSVWQAKLSFAQSTASTLSNIFSELYTMSGEKSKGLFYIMKAAAIAEAIVNTAVAVTAALKPGGPWAIAQAAVIAAMGGVQVAKIMSTMMKGPEGKAKGGIVEGEKGTDRVPIRATAGEYVVRKGAVDQYGVSFMDMINRGVVDTGNLMSAMLSRKKRVPSGIRRFQAGGMVGAERAVDQAAKKEGQGGKTDKIQLEILLEQGLVAKVRHTPEEIDMIVSQKYLTGGEINRAMRQQGK